MDNATKLLAGREHSYASRAFMRLWLPRLELTEARVLGFIIDRTLSFGKNEKKTITVDELINGIETEKYEISGVGKSKSQVLRAIKKLLELGVVVRETVRLKLKNLFKYFVDLTTLLGEKEMSKLKESKRDRGIKKSLVGVTHDTHQDGVGVTHDTSIKHKKEKEAVEKPNKRVRVRAREGVSDNPKQAIEDARCSQLQKRKQKVEEAKTNLNNKNLKATWTELLTSCKYPCPPITWEDVGFLRKALTEVATNFDPLDFIRYTVENWQWLVNKHMSKRTRSPAPQVPAARFLAHNIRYFVRYFGDREAEHDLAPKRDKTVSTDKLKALEKQIASLKSELSEQRKAAAEWRGRANCSEQARKQSREEADNLTKKIQRLECAIDEVDPDYRDRIFQDALEDDAPLEEWK